MKKLHIESITLLLFTFIASCFLLSCPSPYQPGTPKAEITVGYYIDPYIIQDKQFRLCISVDTPDAVLGEYELSIVYDTSKLELVTSKGQSGVEAGLGGFVSSVDSGTAGHLKVTGTSAAGAGPGLGFEMIIIDLNAIDSGGADINVSIDKFNSITGQPIEVQDSISKTFVIGTPVDFPLTGRVVDGIGGSPVEGAAVRLENTSYPAAITNSNGEFAFSGIKIGVYDLLVTKEGRAGSKISRMRITEPIADIEVIQPLYAFLPNATTPPSIMVTGVSPGREYSGNLRINITVNEGSCPVIGTEFHSSIYLRFGSTTMTYFEAAKSNTDSLYHAWNTGLIHPGPANVKIVAYDNNNNRCELNIPVTISANAGNVPSLAPTKDDYTIIASTFGRGMNIYRSNVIGETASPLTRFPADTTVYVEFGVARYYNGMVVYKSSSSSGSYELCGETTYTLSGYYMFVDYSPSLEPGTTVWYKLAYYNQYGIGPFTEPIEVLIQRRYHLELVSPADNLIVADTTPTLGWACIWLDGIEPVGERTDWILVTNLIDASIVTYSFTQNKITYTLPELLPNNRYEWEISSLYESRSGSVISRSFPNGQGKYDHSINGSFYFTVGESK